MQDAGKTLDDTAAVDLQLNGGKSVVIHIYRKEDMTALVETAQRLTDETLEAVDLHDLFPVRYRAPIKSLSLRLCPGDTWMRKSIFLETESDGVVILWETTSLGWYQNSGLLDGLLQGWGSAGHQYFDFDIDDDAEIVIEIYG